MGSIKDYFSSLGSGIVSLVKGLQVTGKEFVTPKITEYYPEDRKTYKWPKRFRAVLELIYDKEGNHRCIACGTCERVCPNGTISLTTKMVDTPDGRKKKKLDKYIYDLGTCTFCNLCVTNCPTDALEFSNDFEQAVFTRDKLVKKLNYLPEKPEPELTPEQKTKIEADRKAKIEAAMKAKAAAAPAAGAPAAATANDKAATAANKAIEAAKAAVAAAATPEEKAKAEEKLAKIEAAMKAKAAKDAAAAAAAAPTAAAPAPVEDKAAAAANKALEAAKAAVAAAATPEDKAKAEEKLAKIEAALKAKAARDAAK